MNTKQYPFLSPLCVLVGIIASAALHAHGDVNPQPVDVEGLPELDGWGDSNPYRELDGDILAKVVRTGERGYGQNCAACHGLGGVSGGIAPDLRMLEPGLDDEYFIGMIQSGGKGMPSFQAVLEPEAVWAIKTWLETKYDEAMEERYGN